MSEFEVDGLSGVEALTSDGWVPIEYCGGYAEVLGSDSQSVQCGPKSKETTSLLGSSLSMRVLQFLHIL